MRLRENREIKIISWGAIELDFFDDFVTLLFMEIRDWKIVEIRVSFGELLKLIFCIFCKDSLVVDC